MGIGGIYGHRKAVQKLISACHVSNNGSEELASIRNTGDGIGARTELMNSLPGTSQL